MDAEVILNLYSIDVIVHSRNRYTHGNTYFDTCTYMFSNVPTYLGLNTSLLVYFNLLLPLLPRPAPPRSVTAH